MLQRRRHLRGGDISQLEKGGEEFLVAGSEADAHTRQVRALRQRLECDHVGEVGPGALQRAARRLPGVDLRIALVTQDHEAVTVGELLQLRVVVARGDRALRIGRRGEEDCHRSRQRRLVERVEIRQEAVGARRRQIDRLAISGPRAGGIGRIERIRDQKRGFAFARADVTGGGDCSEENPSRLPFSTKISLSGSTGRGRWNWVESHFAAAFRNGSMPLLIG